MPWHRGIPLKYATESDEFITCIFRVVLGIERRMGYQVKACSKIFCLSGNPPLGVTVLGSARAFS